MTKREFLERLNQLLYDIPKTEREDACFYYEEYFDEANIGDMDNVLGKIDTPEKIAASIKAGLQGNENSGEYTERGYYEEEAKVDNEIMRNAYQKDNKGEGYFKKKMKEYTEKWKLDKSKMILIIIILVVTFPLWIGVVAGLFGALLGVLGAALGLVASMIGILFSFVVGSVSATFGFLIKGITFIVTGVIGLAEVPTVGITTIGIGLICFGIGVFCAMLSVWIFSTMIPACIRGIKWVYQRLLGKQK